MPTYDYKCEKCGHRFEKFEKISDLEKEKCCPICGQIAKRLISNGAGVIFKGKGFYITDYSNKHSVS